MLRLSRSICCFFRKYPHALWGFYVPVYLLMFFGVEALVPSTAAYWETSMAVDAVIPFAEIFVVPYCLWYPMLVAVGLWLIFKDGPAFRRYMWSLMFMFTFSMIFCAIVPNGQDLRPAVFARDNFFTRWIGAIYSADTNTNVLPSVHVVGTLAALFAVMDTNTFKKRWVRPGMVILSSLIVASTVFIKQHSVLDVLAGFGLAIINYQFIYAPRFIPELAGAIIRRLKRIYHASRTPLYRQTIGMCCLSMMHVVYRLMQTVD